MIIDEYGSGIIRVYHGGHTCYGSRARIDGGGRLSKRAEMCESRSVDDHPENLLGAPIKFKKD